MKFSLATLLSLLLVAALGCAALAEPNDLWRKGIVTLAICALLGATLAAAVDRSRTFALAFALAGWIYLSLSFVPALDMRDDLLTDWTLRWMYTAIHDEEVPHQGDVYSLAFSPQGRVLAPAVNSNNWGYRQWNVANRAQVPRAAFDDFVDVGHGLWTLVVACLGGVTVRLCAVRRSSGSAMSRPRQFSLRSVLFLTTIVAAYLGGWISNEWRQRNQPQPATSVRMRPAQNPVIRVQAKTVHTSGIEEGMKADEWEMRQRLRRALQSDGMPAEPWRWSVD